MKAITVGKIACLFTYLILLQAFADPPQTIINNNNGAPAQAQGSPCPPANQNNIYDPRVPPAGVYSSRGADGSSSTTYTTGEKKPYLTDNGCNNSAATVQPFVVMPGR